MRNAMSWSGMAAVLAAVTGCQAAETPEQMQARIDQESATFRQFIQSVATRYESWLATGAADSIASMFTESGRMLPPNAPAVIGRDAIRANQSQQFALGRWTIEITPEAGIANGPLGLDRGTFVVTFTPGPGAPPQAAMIPPADTGKYVAHWHQVDGNWLFADLIWNSNRPMPAPAPTRRR